MLKLRFYGYYHPQFFLAIFRCQLLRSYGWRWHGVPHILYMFIDSAASVAMLDSPILSSHSCRGPGSSSPSSRAKVKGSGFPSWMLSKISPRRLIISQNCGSSTIKWTYLIQRMQFGNLIRVYAVDNELPTWQQFLSGLRYLPPQESWEALKIGWRSCCQVQPAVKLCAVLHFWLVSRPKTSRW